MSNSQNKYTIVADSGYRNCMQGEHLFKLKLPCGVRGKKQKGKILQLNTEQANKTRYVHNFILVSIVATIRE